MLIFQNFIGWKVTSQSASIGGKKRKNQWTSIEDSKLVKYLKDIANNMKQKYDHGIF